MSRRPTPKNHAGLRLALLLVACALQSPVAAGSPTPAGRINAVLEHSEVQPEPPAWWRRQREGWFWYEDPPAAVPTPRERAIDAEEDAQARELARFEAMQQRLERLKRIAVMNPSERNLGAYMRAQREVMDRAEAFASGWQRLVWREPEFDYSLRGRPTQALAVGAFDEAEQAREKALVRQLASTHGLIFVFRGDCPFCHRFAPILHRFARQHGLAVLAVSLDGGSLAEFPDARPDNGMAARLSPRAVPALYLTHPGRREIRPVGFGLMSEADLLERLASLARETSPGHQTARSTP